MSQNILTISQESFEFQLPSINNKTLLKIVEGIAEMCQNKIPEEQLMDLQRKWTKIEAELTRRGSLNKRTRPYYDEFIRKIKYKKRLF